MLALFPTYYFMQKHKKIHSKSFYIPLYVN